MKVKNIVFTGFMAAILSATGAHAAISVASQGYVDSKVGDVATSVSTLSTTVADTYQTKEAATAQHQTLQNAIDLKVAKDAYDAKIKTLEDADATFATKTELSSGLDDKQDKLELGANLEFTADGKLDTKGIATTEGLSVLTERVTTAETDIEGLQGSVNKLDGDANTDGSVKKQIADAIASEVSRSNEAYAAKSIEDTVSSQGDKITALEGQFGETGTTTVAIKAAQDAADAAQGAADAAQGAADAAQGTANANAAAIEAINNAENGILAQAKADAATKLAGAMEDIAEAYLAKPAACATTYCVLSVNGENVSWMPLTEPQETYYPEEE